MQWTVQVGVALLNVVWVAFFLQPDPLSVFVQRRSTDTYEEFCIKPPPDMNWISTVQSDNITATETSNISTASEEPVQRTSTDSSEEVFLQTTSEMKQISTVQPDNITAKETSNISTASEESEPGNLHEPEIRRKFETNPVRPPSQGRPASPFGESCCLGFASRRVPKRLISSYYVTDFRCPRPGVIFVTQKRASICVDPSLPWVKSIMEFLDEKYF